MTHHANEVTKDQLIGEFNTVVAETEQLLKSVATAGGEKAVALRTGVEQNLAAAKQRVQKLQQAASGQVKAAARSTDEYAHQHPWQAIGIVAGLTAVAGVLLGLMLTRR